MIEQLTHRKAILADLVAIINLLSEDELGKGRENQQPTLDQRYIDAFHRINTDPQQYLMVVEQKREIVATCHLTIMPSLTFMGATKMQIEAVRVAEKYRGQKIGEWMMEAAIDYGRIRGISIIQLITNKKRIRAKQFYERLGFEATHEGMRLMLTEKSNNIYL